MLVLDFHLRSLDELELVSGRAGGRTSEQNIFLDESVRFSSLVTGRTLVSGRVDEGAKYYFDASVRFHSRSLVKLE